jgi:hypothetical protein
MTSQNTGHCSGFYKQWRNSRNKLWHYIKIIINCLGFLPPRKTPRYSLYRRLGWPQNRSGRLEEEKHLFPARNPTPAVHPYACWDAMNTALPCPESNPSCPPLCLLRCHEHSCDKNGVYSTLHLIFTWFQSSIASCMRACSYQPHPPAVRVVLREQSSHGNRSSERTSRKTPPDCYLRAAAWQCTQETHQPLVGPLP